MVRGAHMDREERGREEEGRRGRDNPRVLDVRPGKGREEGGGKREEGGIGGRRGEVGRVWSGRG